MGWLGDSNHRFLFAAYFALAIVAIAQFLSIGRLKKHWRSYQLILEADCLRERTYSNDVMLLRSQIIKINEDQHGLFVISDRGYSQTAMDRPIHYRQVRDRLSSIWIPAGLIGYQQVRAEVLQWTDRVSQRRSLWLTDLKPVLICTVSLLPAMLLMRSVSWLLIAAAVYYGMVLLAIMIHVVRPPRNSGLTPRRRGLDLPPPAYMWRRFKHRCRFPPILVLLFLPIVRIALPS
jgi:hypothetical protein